MKIEKILSSGIALLVALSLHADLSTALEKMSGSDYGERQQARDELYSIAATVTSVNVPTGDREAFAGSIVDALSDPAIDKQGKIFLTRILARAGTMDSVPALLEIASDQGQDIDLRDHAVMAASAIPGKGVTDQLVSGLRNASGEDKTMWWQALSMQAEPSAVQEIIRQIGKASISKDKTGWKSISKIGGPDAAAFLFNLLGEVSSGNMNLLQKAVLATESCDSRQLRKLYDSADDPEIQTGAFVQLLEVDPRAALAKIKDLLQKEPTALRQNIIRASLDSMNRDSWDLIVPEVGNLHPAEINTVLAAIGEQQRVEYEGLVIKYLDAGHEENQLEALRTLARIGTSISTPVLLGKIDSDDETVQELAIYALSQVQDPDLDNKIIASVRQPGSENRGLMIRLLGIRNSEGTADILNGLLAKVKDDPDDDEIFDAVEETGDIDTCKILLNELINTSDSSLVRQYQLILKRLTIRLALGDEMWESAFHPALLLASNDRARANVIEILDCLSSSRAALDYCTDILENNRSADLQKSALAAIKRWSDMNVAEYWLRVAKNENSSESDVKQASAALARVIRSSSVEGGGSAKADLAFDIIMDDIDQDLKGELMDAIRSNKEVSRQFTNKLEPYKDLIEDWESE